LLKYLFRFQYGAFVALLANEGAGEIVNVGNAQEAVILEFAKKD
jgi:hypothetical protein